MWRPSLYLGSLMAGGGLLAIVLATASVASTATGCDPELNVIKTPGSEGGVGEGGASSSSSSSSSSGGDGGEPSEGGNTDNDSGPIDDDSGGPSGHKIDGTNDFAANAKLATTSSASGYDAYVSWDATRIYFGMAGADVGSKATNKWVLVYIGVPGSAGGTTRTGINYGGQQQPTLPFDTTHHLRWKASGDFTTVEVFSGGMWKASDPFIPVVAAQQGNFMEMSVTRAALGATGKINVHMNMLIEGGSADWTYAGVPSISFTDGKNPNPFSKYFEFDLADTTTASSAYTPK